MDHQSQGLNEGLREYSNSADHWSNGLNNKGRRDQSCHTTHQSRGLDRSLRVCSDQTDHQSNRPNENSGEQYGQTDYRSTGPDKGSKCYSGVLAHRSTRPDNSSGEHLGPQDQQNSIKANKKFSSHRGLKREISTDSQTSDQECDKWVVQETLKNSMKVQNVLIPINFMFVNVNPQIVMLQDLLDPYFRLFRRYSQNRMYFS